MFHIIQLTTWIVASASKDKRFRGPFAALAVGQLCLSCYWFGASEFTKIEILSSISVTILGIIIGSSMQSYQAPKTQTESRND